MEHLALILAVTLIGGWMSWVNRKLVDISLGLKGIKGAMVLRSFEDAAGED